MGRAFDKFLKRTATGRVRLRMRQENDTFAHFNVVNSIPCCDSATAWTWLATEVSDGELVDELCPLRGCVRRGQDAQQRIFAMRGQQLQFLSLL